MALETVVYAQDLFSYGCKDLCSSLAAALSHDSFKAEEKDDEEEEKEGAVECGMISTHPLVRNPEVLLGRGIILDGLNGNNWDSSSTSMVQNYKQWDANSSPEACTPDGLFPGSFPASGSVPGRKKRRRAKSCKNKEEVENQRMTHIAVERNRRKQMNEYLSILRSLMPPSYVQRGDQASVIGGAINFVKELEQHLQSMETHKRTTLTQQLDDHASCSSPPFANFFTFPQYSSCANSSNPSSESLAENSSAIADIEVTMVESHANLKVLTRKRPKQLLHMVAGFQCLYLTILHLNVTAMDQMVLYSFSVKVEENCTLTSVDEIATAVYQMVGRIQREGGL